MVAHYVRDVGVGRSSRLIPTFMKSIFYLQRNDRIAIIAIVVIIAIICSLIIFIGGNDDGLAKEDADSTLTHRPTHVDKEHPLYYKVDEQIHELFAFDPNTADSTDLLRLGLQEWQVRSIYRYRAKGGIYRRVEDFARLYGLTKKQYETLRPYIIIGEDYRPASDYYGQQKDYAYSRQAREEGKTENFSATGQKDEERIYSYPQKLKAGEHVSLNTADTTELKKIPGIGSAYSRAIVRYRERLGGYVNANQLLEIEGFPEEALPFMQVENGKIAKLKINKLTINQLRRHPYLNFYQARDICDYRRLHGPIKSLRQLSLLTTFPPAQIERLEPYVSYE